MDTMEILQQIEGRLEEEKAKLTREMEDRLKARKAEAVREFIAESEQKVAQLEGALETEKGNLEQARTLLSDLEHTEEAPAEEAPLEGQEVAQ